MTDEPEDDEYCEACGAHWRERCEHLQDAERQLRNEEADREAAWWKNVGSVLLGLPDEEQ